MLKTIILFTLLLNTFLFAQEPTKKEELKEKHIKEQIEREKKYSIEQTFYKGKHYDLKEAEVDDKSVKKLPDVSNTNEDFDMDSVYD